MMRRSPDLGIVLTHLRSITLLLGWILLAAPVALNASAANLGDLNVPSERIPTWHPFDESLYEAAKSWPEYDVTCSSASCASGKLPFTQSPDLANRCGPVSQGDFSQMNCMIENAPDFSALFLPAGTYPLGSGQALLIGRSNIVIRGAGRSRTVLRRDVTGRDYVRGCTDGANSGGGGVSVCPGQWDGNGRSWTSGYAVNTNVITVSSTAGFQVGGWIRLDMAASTACEYLESAHNGVFTHLAKITNISGNQIVIDRGLRMKYDGRGCSGFTAYPFLPLSNVGVESLRLTTNTNIPINNTRWPIVTRGLVDSWFVGLKIDRTAERWTDIRYSARVWFQGNDFENVGPQQYNEEGMMTRQGSDVVWENNTCMGVKMCQQYYNGAEGSVAAYNYFRQDDVNDIGGTVGCERSFQIHGRYNREILIEGNDVNCNIQLADEYWGQNGERITAYRNRNVSSNCRGARSFVSIDATEGGGGSIDYSARYLNVIGNTTGRIRSTVGSCGDRSPNGYGMSATSEFLWVEKNAYRDETTLRVDDNTGVINNRSCGTGENDTCPGTNARTNSPLSLWRTEAYPTSLYRGDTAPSWWCQEACPWSQAGIGAFGDDFNGSLCKLPAQIRYEGGTCTPVSPTTPSNRPPAPIQLY